jgi:hypothetical protein
MALSCFTEPHYVDAAPASEFFKNVTLVNGSDPIHWAAKVLRAIAEKYIFSKQGLCVGKWRRLKRFI